MNLLQRTITSAGTVVGDTVKMLAAPRNLTAQV